MIIPWLVSTVACITAGAIAFYRHGPGAGVGVALALSLLVPTWIVLSIGGWPLDVRLATAAVMVSAYCFHPAGRFLSRPTLIDLSLAGLVIWHVASDWINTGVDWLVPLRAYGEWALPFVAGWFAVMHRGSISFLAPWFAGVAIVAGLLAVPETLTGNNFWEGTFGKVDDLVKVPTGQRFDFLHRAMGATRHPIFFAIVMMLLVPWSVALLRDERQREWRFLGWAGLAGAVVGMLATLSRGPLLALVIAGTVAASFYSIWARRAFAVAVAAGLLAAVFGWSTLIEFLDRTDRSDQSWEMVEVDGEFEQHTGSRNRLFVVRIYGPLVMRGGAFGYGTPAVSSFPPKIPGLPASARSREILGIVDNSFVLIGLRFGLVGLALLILLLGSSIYCAFTLARQMSLVTYPNGPGFLVALGSVLIGVSAEILTVFSSYEFFFWILFTCGVVSGLASLDLRSRLGEVQID